LVNLIKARFPDAQAIGLDLIDRPSSVRDDVEWISANVMDELSVFDEDTVVVGNLFLHHLQDDQLRVLGERLSNVSAYLFSEPFRAKLPQVMGLTIFPLVNDVTKHDMMVSIRAGFTIDELPKLLGGKYLWSETKGLCGGLRTKGVKI